MFQGKRAVVLEKIRSHGTGSSFQEIGKIFPVVDLLSEIQLTHLAARKDCHNVTDIIVK